MRLDKSGRILDTDRIRGHEIPHRSPALPLSKVLRPSAPGKTLTNPPHQVTDAETVVQPALCPGKLTSGLEPHRQEENSSCHSPRIAHLRRAWARGLDPQPGDQPPWLPPLLPVSQMEKEKLGEKTRGHLRPPNRDLSPGGVGPKAAGSRCTH